MEKKTFTLNLADDTQIPGLELNGNCYISSKKVAAEQFTDVGLKKVVVNGSDGSQEIRENLALVSVWKDGSRYWIALRDKTPDEVYREQLESQLADANNAVAELSEMIATMQA